MARRVGLYASPTLISGAVNLPSAAEIMVDAEYLPCDALGFIVCKALGGGVDVAVISGAGHFRPRIKRAASFFGTDAALACRLRQRVGGSSRSATPYSGPARSVCPRIP